jgi:adenylate cyclase
MYGFFAPVGGGDSFPLSKKEMVIGRHKTCDIVLNYSNVSSRHCKLVLSEGYWYIIDLQSTNGVKVNGNKVMDRRVDPGSTVTVAKHTFKIQYDPRENGATGLPPDTMLHGGDVFAQSLMQRAGLEKTKPQDTVMDEIDLEMAMPILTTPKPSDNRFTRDFFGELVFD